jgi:ATP-dependent Clp protease adaptor protein ClpS
MADQDQGHSNSQTDSDVEVHTREPSMYAVFLLNDDFTTQEFVVSVLTQFFYKSESEAFQLMLDVHNKGKAQVGVFTKDVAETKVHLVHRAAKENNYPLRCKIEEV